MLFRMQWLASACLFLWLTAAVADAAPRAIVIGTNRYQDHLHLPTLRYAANDAHRLAEVLKESGYAPEHVSVTADDGSNSENTRKDILATLKRQLAQAEKDDSVLVVFAGHGINKNGDSYLCPSDADIDKPLTTMISVSNVYEMLGECSASQKFLVIDACRNEEGRSEEQQFNLLQNLKTLKAQQTGPQGVMCFASALSGQRSAEDRELRQGVFLYFFAEGLRGEADYCCAGNRDGLVTPYEVFQYASVQTRQHTVAKFGTEQTPWFEGHATGDLSLVTLSEDRLADLKRVHRKPELPMTAGQLHSQREYAAALTALQRADMTTVISACSRALDYDADNKLARRTRALAYQVRGEFEQAFADYEKLGEPMLLTVHNSQVEVKAKLEVVATAREGQSLEISSLQKTKSSEQIFNQRTGQYEPRETIWLNVSAIHAAAGEANAGTPAERTATNGWVKLEALAKVTSPELQIGDFQRNQNQQVMVSSYSSRPSNHEAIKNIDRAQQIINNPLIPDNNGWKGKVNGGLDIFRAISGGG